MISDRVAAVCRFGGCCPAAKSGFWVKERGAAAEGAEGGPVVRGSLREPRSVSH